MAFRTDSTIGTVIGIIVMAIAVVGTVFFDWSWENPEGYLLPFVIGIVVAAVAVIMLLRARRR